jgi:hypothetical protein
VTARGRRPTAICAARGKADPAGYRVHLPRKVDVKAMRRMFGMTQETFGLRCGLMLVAMVLVVLALLVLVRTARAPGRRDARLARGRFSRQNHSPLWGPLLGRRRERTCGPI